VPAAGDLAGAYARSEVLVGRLAARLQAQVVETHISWVLLVRDLAYKIKKPVRLPFVDFSTPQRRRHFCEEEVRLNARLAPGLYLGVAPISDCSEAPCIDGDGPAVEYAVRMRRFDESGLFGWRVRHGALDPAAIDRLAERLAAFHRHAPVLRQAGAQGVLGPSLAALDAAAAALAPAQATQLRAWTEREGRRLRLHWAARSHDGHVRECHGDLHLDNIVEFDGRVLAFDGVEFDPALRWIDVTAEIAFPFMDLHRHGRADLAWRLLDAWMEATGDWGVLPGLNAAAVYRALVRAAVEGLKAPGSAEARAYGQAALAFTRARERMLCVTYGLPGSGKTRAPLQWLQAHGAVRVRADVERKRLFGLAPLEDSRRAGLDIYDETATRDTYACLLRLAGLALGAGHPVILDATYIDAAERDRARALADRHGVPFRILACAAPLDVLRQRLRARRGDASEADEAVLDRLAARQEPLATDERALLDPASDAQAVRT
jgi:aminoglycoside phosphotransferase family enzyme/predicted kinase